MSIFRQIAQMPRSQFVIPQMPQAPGSNPIADAQAAAQAEAQRSMQTTGQGGAPLPTPVAPSPTGAPASAAAPTATPAGGGGLMGSIMSMFGGGGHSGGVDPSSIIKLMAMLG